MYGDGFESSISSSITSLIMLTSKLAAPSMSSIQVMHIAGLQVSRQVCSFSLRSEKLAWCMLQEGKEVA